MKFIKQAKYTPNMIFIEKSKICRFILWLGEHIQDTTEVADVSMEYFSSVMECTKFLELKRKKRKAEKEQNKKARTMGGYSGAQTSAPTQSAPQFTESTPFR